MAIAEAFSSLQAASQIVKAILDLRDADLIREKSRELSSLLISAQSETLGVQSQLASAIEEVRKLKDRVMQMEDWRIEKARYELKEVVPGRFAYAIRETERGMQPPHCICAQCYERGFKSILQSEYLAAGRVDLLSCPACKTEIVTKGVRQD